MRGYRVEEGGKVEVRFKGSKRDQRKNGAILMRTADPSCRERRAVELLLELIRRQGEGGVPASLPVMVYRWGGVEGVDERAGGNVSKIGCPDGGKEMEGRRKRGDGKHTVGRIGGATTLAAGGTEPMVVQKEKRCHQMRS